MASLASWRWDLLSGVWLHDFKEHEAKGGSADERQQRKVKDHDAHLRNHSTGTNRHWHGGSPLVSPRL
jgi:hypothetical protein